MFHSTPNFFHPLWQPFTKPLASYILNFCNIASRYNVKAFTTEYIHPSIYQLIIKGNLEYSWNINGRPFDIMRARLINYVLFRNSPHNFTCTRRVCMGVGGSKDGIAGYVNEFCEGRGRPNVIHGYRLLFSVNVGTHIIRNYKNPTMFAIN